MKNILVAAKHIESPFTHKRVLKGQAIEIPRIKDDDPDKAAKLAEIDRIRKRMIEDGRAELSDTALGPYNPGEPDSPGMTEGIHYNIPEPAEQNIVHDGTIESAERLAQLRKNAQERVAVAARKAQSGEKKEPTQEEIDAAKAAELAKNGPQDVKVLEGGEAAKEILKGAETGANADAGTGAEAVKNPAPVDPSVDAGAGAAAAVSTDKPAEPAADDKSGKKGKGK